MLQLWLSLVKKGLKLMPEEEEVQIPLVIIGVEDTPIIFSNFQVVQHEQREFIITFAQYSPPLTLGSPEEQQEALKRTAYLPVKTIARIALTPDRLEQFIDTLQANYEKWRAKQEGGQR